MTLKEQIKNYVPFDEQEEKDKVQFLKFIDTFDNVLTRENIFGHITSSAFVVNKERTKMLVVCHIIDDGWIYPGGHADGEEDLLSVALREVEEETGLKPKVLDNSIFSIQSGPVIGHIKRGKYVSAHIHYDVIYLMEADDKIPLKYKKDESKGAKWIPFENAMDKSVCAYARPIHKKLITKLKKIELKEIELK